MSQQQTANRDQYDFGEFTVSTAVVSNNNERNDKIVDCRVLHLSGDLPEPWAVCLAAVSGVEFGG